MMFIKQFQDTWWKLANLTLTLLSAQRNALRAQVGEGFGLPVAVGDV